MTTKSYGFEGLEVWKYSIELVKNIYTLTKTYPKEELFVLVSQLRRCAISIPSNISESYEKSKPDFLRFMSISLGSCSELKTQIIISFEIDYINEKTKTELLEKINRVIRMLKGLQSSIKK